MGERETCPDCGGSGPVGYDVVGCSMDALDTAYCYHDARPASSGCDPGDVEVWPVWTITGPMRGTRRSWPTVAGYLADAVERLRGVVARHARPDAPTAEEPRRG